jgi:hypothetical protein
MMSDSLYHQWRAWCDENGIGVRPKLAIARRINKYEGRVTFQEWLDAVADGRIDIKRMYGCGKGTEAQVLPHIQAARSPRIDSVVDYDYGYA